MSGAEAPSHAQRAMKRVKALAPSDRSVRVAVDVDPMSMM
jgi:hypothetical protein